jgi:diguanylate cyclase (GGDEF)-like protein
VREVDCAARYGGEELAVVLPQMGLEGAEAVAERMRVAIAGLQVPTADGGTLSVTASVGVAAIERESLTYEDLIASADAALYQAKRAGKNRVVVYDTRGAVQR